MKYMPGFTDFFMSPVTGRIVLNSFPDLIENYVWLGNYDDQPIASPVLIDMQLEIIQLRNRLSKTRFILQAPSTNFDSSQALNDLVPGILRHTDGIVSIATPGTDYMTNYLPYHQVWLGNEENVATPVDRIWDDGVGNGNLPAYASDKHKWIWRMNEAGVPVLTNDLTTVEVELEVNIELTLELQVELEANIELTLELQVEVNLALDLIATINAQLTVIFDAIAVVNAQIVAINTAIGVINAQIVAINTAIAVVNAQIVAINTAIGVIDADVALINSTLVSLQTQIDTNVSSGLGHLADLQLEIDSAISSGMDHLADINNQFDVINTQITDIDTTISDIETSIGDGVVTLTGDVTGSGNVGTPIATTITLTLDQIPLALGEISANINKITDVVDPIDAQDAATKNYVDSLVGDGTIQLTGNVLGTGVVGTPFNTDLSSNILTLTGDQTFSYPDTSSSTAFALINTFEPSLLTPSNMELTLENYIGSGYQLLVTSSYPGGTFPDGVFQFYGFTAGDSTLIYQMTSDLVTFNIPVTMTTNMSMASNKITNVTNPTSAQDAATKNYVDTRTITLTGAVSGSGALGTTISTTLSTTANLPFSFFAPLSSGSFNLISGFTPVMGTSSQIQFAMLNSLFNGVFFQFNTTYSGGTDPEGVFRVFFKSSTTTLNAYNIYPTYFEFAFPVTMLSTLDMGSNLINDVADPVSAQDAATKNYVDSSIAAGTIVLTGNVTGSGTVGTSFATTLNMTLNTIPVPVANVNLNSYKLINVTDPTLAQDAATKNYVDTRTLSSFGAPTGNISLNSNKITNLATPTLSTDATTKGYVDGRTITLTGDVTGTNTLGSSIATTLATTIARSGGAQAFTFGTIQAPVFRLTNGFTPTVGNNAINVFTLSNSVPNNHAQFVFETTSTGANIFHLDLYQGASGVRTFDCSQTQFRILLPLDMNTQKITNMGNPTSAQDAATKNYVDSRKACGGMYNNATAGSQVLTGGVFNSLTTTFDASVNLLNFTKTANNVLKYTGTPTIYVSVNASLGFSFNAASSIVFAISKNGGYPSPSQGAGPWVCVSGTNYVGTCTAILQLSTNDTVGVYGYTSVGGTFSNFWASMNVITV